jgi:ABC-type branched-subunit amino acid transport system substrate-binding protein
VVRRPGRLFAAVVILALATASCGNADDSDDEAEATTTTAADEGGSDNGESGGESDRDTFVPVDAPGVTDEEIRFGSISTISGNILGTNIGPDYNEGVEAYFAWRNSEGGIYGRELVLDPIYDDQLGNNAQRAQELVSSNSAFGSFGATLLFTGAKVLEDNGIPTFAWGIHVEFIGKRNLFGHVGPICQGCPGPTWPYLASLSDASKVGVLAYNTSEVSSNCAEGIRDSVGQYGDDVGGMEVAFYDANLNFGLPGGLAPQVSEMKDAGVDYIGTCMDLNGVKVLGDELAKQGMDDVVIQHPNTYDAEFVAANADIFDGDLVITTFLPFEAEVDSELQDKFFEWTDELDIERHELTMVGWINADLAFNALLGAGPQFDRAKVVDAARSMTHYTADNLIAPIDWSRQIEDPATNEDARAELVCIAGVRIESGEFVQGTGEEGKPWVCWDTANNTYTEPEVIGDFG